MDSDDDIYASDSLSDIDTDYYSDADDTDVTSMYWFSSIR